MSLIGYSTKWAIQEKCIGLMYLKIGIAQNPLKKLRLNGKPLQKSRKSKRYARKHDMKYIDTLDQNQVKSLFDYKDGHLYWKKNGKKAGYLRPTGYYSVEVNGKGLMLHRLIWIYHFGKPNAFIDHIDGNKGNNLIENLRLATKNQNSYNKKIHPNNKLGVKGLRLRKDNNKYEARICVDGKRLVLGGFDDLELAELVIFEARDKYHGAYANHG